MNLQTRIAIHQDWGNVAADPDWTGTVKEFWSANEAVTCGEIRELLNDLDTSGSHRIGGGAAGAFTIKLAEALDIAR